LAIEATETGGKALRISLRSGCTNLS